MAAALALIERTGSAEAVTLRAVAREVGIAAPSIYAHFPDRDAVLMAVVVRIFDELTEAIEQGTEVALARTRPAAWSQAARRTWPSGSSTPPVTACCSPRQRPAAPDYCKPVPIGPDGRPVLEFGAETFALLVQAIEDCVTSGVSASTDVARRRHRRVGRPARDRQPAHRATTLPVARPGRIRPPPRAVASPGDRLSS